MLDAIRRTIRTLRRTIFSGRRRYSSTVRRIIAALMRDDFAALLEETLGGRDFHEGTVVQGKVVALEKDFAVIDVGLKTEGRVSLKEFGAGEDTKPLLAQAVALRDEMQGRIAAAPVLDELDP